MSSPIKKTASAKAASENTNNEKILKANRLKDNAAELFNAGLIPRDWFIYIVSMAEGATK